MGKKCSCKSKIHCLIISHKITVELVGLFKLSTTGNNLESGLKVLFTIYKLHVFNFYFYFYAQICQLKFGDFEKPDLNVILELNKKINFFYL